MSLLEDVFLEDEAGEAQELERIIEGDEYDERPRPSTPDSNENSEKEDEAEEDKKHVDPTSAKPKRVVKNPRVILNPARLTGPRGIQVIPEHFKDFTFKGKGHEKEDLDLVLKKLEHWAYRLYPKFEFKDCLKKMETLGNKRPVMVHLTKIRTDQLLSTDTVVQRESSDDDDEEPAAAPAEDEFDKLLQQQIDLARATPAPGTASKGLTTPVVDRSLTMPKATSSPSINDEQRERMLRNRQLAEERRLARLKLINSETGQENTNNNTDSTTILESSTNDILKGDLNYNNGSEERNGNTIDKLATFSANINTNVKNVLPDVEENITRVKSNRSNVIDSSDSEDGGLVINESVTVDVHNHRIDDSDDESDSHQNENRNTVVVHQSENVEEIHSDIVCQNEKEQDSDIVYQNEKQQNENKRCTDIDHQNKNNVEEIGHDTDDVEMNNISNVNELISNKAEEPVLLNVLGTNNKDSNIDIEEKTKNKEDSEVLQSSSTVVSKQISEKENPLNNVVDSSTGNTEAAEKIKETALADIDDIMDVDFSDAF